jgi:hypothetical protein
MGTSRLSRPRTRPATAADRSCLSSWPSAPPSTSPVVRTTGEWRCSPAWRPATHADKAICIRLGLPLMISLNGTRYRLALLDTNAVSEMVKHPALFGRFLAWAHEAPMAIPSFSLFTILELRRSASLYRQFVERYSIFPCVVLKSHEQLLGEEVSHYPDPTIDPILVGFASQLTPAADLESALNAAFGSSAIRTRENYWNSGRQGIVAGIRSLVQNYPPSGQSYTPTEIRAFVEIAGFSQLVYRHRDFAERVSHGMSVEIDAFPSLKASLYTVFHKFYVDSSRVPSLSDAFDIVISAAVPYVDVVFTENHQAEVLRKTQRLDQFIGDLEIYTLRDLRRFPHPGLTSD